jgi:hypothetical protein
MDGAVFNRLPVFAESDELNEIIVLSSLGLYEIFVEYVVMKRREIDARLLHECLYSR